jgi:excinuclease ABC subunit A
VDQVGQRLLALPAGSRWYALFPVSTPVIGNAHPDTKALRDHLFDLRKKGFNRLFQAGRTFEFSTPESLLDIDFSKPVFVLVDRLVIPAEQGPELRQRMVDTVEIGYREAGEIVL